MSVAKNLIYVPTACEGRREMCGEANMYRFADRWMRASMDKDCTVTGMNDCIVES
jgi:hypothetical protein